MRPRPPLTADSDLRIPSIRRARCRFTRRRSTRSRTRTISPRSRRAWPRSSPKFGSIVENPAAPTFENTFVPLEKSGRLLAESQRRIQRRHRREHQSRAAAGEDRPRAEARRAPRCHLLERANCLHACPPSTSARSIKSSIPNRGGWSKSRTINSCIPARTVGCREGAAEKAERGGLDALERLHHQSAGRRQGWGVRDRHARGARGIERGADRGRGAGGAGARRPAGYVLPLQNTTQQPALASLSVRATREAIFEKSWNRTERADANDTRATSRGWRSCARSAPQLLGYPNHAAWKLEDQMAKTPEAALEVHGCAGARATAKAAREGKDIQAVDRRAGRAASHSSLGIGSSTPSRSARPSTISTMRK